MTKRFGFTLAEVLITLGIIGVVAAMTMPTLMTQTNGVQFKSAYKKTMSTIANAAHLASAQDGYDFTGTSAQIRSIVDTYTVINDIKVGNNVRADYRVNGALPANGNDVLFFNDGSVITYNRALSNCSLKRPSAVAAACKAVIDVNGYKGPNTLSTCTNSNGMCANGTLQPKDQYPVYFYRDQVRPNSPAARAVLAE